MTEQTHEFVADIPRSPGLCATCCESRRWHPPTLRDRMEDAVDDALAFECSCGCSAGAAVDALLAVLDPAERQILTFALDLAADQMASCGGDFSDEDRSALTALRSLAAGKGAAS